MFKRHNKNDVTLDLMIFYYTAQKIKLSITLIKIYFICIFTNYKITVSSFTKLFLHAHEELTNSKNKTWTFIVSAAWSRLLYKAEFVDQPWISRAREHSIKAHKAVNQKFDKKYPYHYHLSLVFLSAVYLIYQLHVEGYKLTKEQIGFILSAAWGHDLIEDAQLTYNDCVKIFGKPVAEIIYACTNEKGKTREERFNEKFYNELIQNDLAVIVKCADRHANMIYSKRKGAPMYEKYKKESVKFFDYMTKTESGKFIKIIFENQGLI